ncbi:unnamed protein product [Brassicogethes aeneus]|uniref:Cadherin domain-containing protein n=1 Tax=Brassicogethes aeneus TaxID=1431903 RepID=A0A9P0B5D6_BRAAE|nr:unnamed protein product [Brassicogethes aeneus]
MGRVVFIFICFFGIVSSDETNKCAIQLEWNFDNYILGDDTDENPILSEYEQDTTIGNLIESFSCNPSLKGFFDDFALITGATDKETNKFQIKKNFSNFDELINSNNPGIKDNKFEISYTCKINCDPSSRDSYILARFLLNITDTDQHTPEFSKLEYDIKVPMPLPKGTDITAFNKINPIYTIDKDFSNKKISYSLSNEDFLTNSIKDNTKYTLEMEVTSKLNLVEDTPYVITATDDGGKNATATLNIKVDKENSIPDQPNFLEPSYEFLYDVFTPSEPTISTDATIRIKTDHKDILEVGVEPDYEANIQCNQTGTDSEGYVTVECTCLKEFTDSNVYYLVKLNAKTDESSSTTLIIKSKDFSSGPQFQEGYYEATYNPEEDTVKLTTSIKTNIAPISVDLQGEYNEYFKTRLDNDQWTIERTVKKFEETILHKKFINFVLVSKSESGETGRTSLTMNMPNLKASFDKVVYNASLDMDTNFKCDAITINNYIDGVTAKFVDESKYFTFKQNNKMVDIIKKEPFPSDLPKEKYLSVKIQLTEDMTIVQTSILNVDLPLDDGNTNNEEELSEKDKQIKGYIAAVAILSVLLVASIFSFGLVYYLKLRKLKARESNISERKYPFEEKYQPNGVDEIDENYNEPAKIRVEEIEEIEKPKSVAFNEFVEELEIDSNHEEDDKTSEAEEEDLERKKARNEEMAKRRPTGFVFNRPPIEDDDED